MALADTYDRRHPAGQYDNVLDGLAVVNCADGRDTAGFTVAETQRIAAAAPFMDPGDPAAAIEGACTHLPPSRSGPAPLGDLNGLPTVLVYSVTGDPATPYQSGVGLAEALDARLVTVNGNTHTVFLWLGDDCVDDIGTRYLVAVELPASGTTC